MIKNIHMNKKLDEILEKFNNLNINYQDTNDRLSNLEKMFSQLKVSNNNNNQDNQNRLAKLLVCQCNQHIGSVICSDPHTIFKIQSVMSNDVIDKQYMKCFWCVYIFLMNNRDILDSLSRAIE